MFEKPKKNRIVINFGTMTLEVESTEAPLEEVFGVVDMIARNMGKSSVAGEYKQIEKKKMNKKLAELGIQ